MTELIFLLMKFSVFPVPWVPGSLQVPRRGSHSENAAGHPHQRRRSHQSDGSSSTLAQAIFHRSEDPVGIRRHEEDPERSLATDYPDAGLHHQSTGQLGRSWYHAAGAGGRPSRLGYHLQSG